MDLIGRLQKRVSQPTGKPSVGGPAPTVLKVHLALSGLEVARNHFSGKKEVPSLVLVVGFIVSGEQAGNRSRGKVIGLAERAVDRRVAKGCWIQAGSRIGDTRGAQPEYVGYRRGNVLGVAGAVVSDNPQVATKLEGMLSLRPTDVVHQIVHRHVG